MMTPTQSPNASSKEELRLLWQMSGLAFQFGTEIIAGVLLGWGFDALFGTRPWGILVGSLAGIAVGTADLTRRAIKINRQMDRAHPIRPRKQSGEGAGGGAGGAASGTASGADENELLDADFDEALSHEQWKKAQDKKLNPDDDDKPRHDGT